MIAIEVVCCSPDDVADAQECGVDRVELCIAIEHGGLTPSVGFVEQARKLTQAKVVAMLRHQNGGFTMGPHGLEVLRRDAQALADAGAQGLVLAALTAEGDVDYQACSSLIRGLEHLELTFHRAIDTVPNPIAAMRRLADLGFTRILASGGGTSAVEGAPNLAAWVAATQGQLTICPAGGLRSHNVVSILKQTGVQQTHQGPFVTFASPHADPLLFGEHRRLNLEEVKATVAAVRAYEASL